MKKALLSILVVVLFTVSPAFAVVDYFLTYNAEFIQPFGRDLTHTADPFGFDFVNIIPSTISPNQQVTVDLQWVFIDQGYTGAIVYLNAFGDWNPGTELARLINGQSESSVLTGRKNFTFQAPSTPGEYRIRVVIVWAFAPVRNFYGSPPNGQYDPGVGPYTEVKFTVSDTTPPPLPTVYTGGPFEISPGGSITLSADLRWSEDVLACQVDHVYWYIDGVEVVDEVIDGHGVTLSYDYLTDSENGIGLSLGQHVVTLEFQGGVLWLGAPGWEGFTASDSTTLTIGTTPPATVSVTVNAPEQVEMGTKYYVDVNITPSESWQGGWINLTVIEANNGIHADWDIRDNLYIDSGALKLRPESLCYAWIWDTLQNEWIKKTDTPYYIGYEPASINIWVPGVLTTRCRFEAYHKWHWVPPWDMNKFYTAIVSAVDLTGVIKSAILANTIATALNGQTAINFTYSAIALGSASSDTTMVKWTLTQQILMGTSVGLGINSLLTSAVASSLETIEPITAETSRYLGVAFTISAWGYYIAASDPPDFNYTEIAMLEMLDVPELNQISDPNYREAAKKALEFIAYQKALLKSLERYDGAKIDGMPQFMALQMGATQLCSKRIRELSTALRGFWCSVTATLPIPTPDQIQQARQNLLQNGLPEIEVNILSAFGYSDEQMTQITNATASLPDEWFTSPETICTTLNLLVESFSQNLKFVSGPEVNIIFPESGQVVQNSITLAAEVNDQNIVDAVSFYLGEPNNENGVPTEYQELVATFDSNTGLWQYYLDTTQLPDGYYDILAKSVDIYGNIGWSKIVPFRIQNNHPPVANAGPDQTVYAWIDGIAEVNLDGSGSYDEDNQPLTYLWSWTIDGNTYDANGVKPSIELPVGQHTISLIVNDGTVDSEPNEVNITVVGPVEANLCMTPKVLNCKGFQPKIMATLRLPKGITKDQIDTNEPILLYPGEIEAAQIRISQDKDKCKVLHTVIQASFDKNELMSVIDDDGQVGLAVVGRLKTGQYFFGTDNIRVICPGHWPWHRPWFNHRWTCLP
jgi:hypothetical protein